MRIHINQAELLGIAECKQKSTLVDWLHENRIPYKLSKKGHVWTTKDQLESSFTKEAKQGFEFGT